MPGQSHERRGRLFGTRLRETSARVARRAGSRTSMQRSSFSTPGRCTTAAMRSAGIMSCTSVHVKCLRHAYTTVLSDAA